MTMALKIEIQGANALLKGLKKLTAAAESIVEEEVEVGVQDIRTTAVSLVPVDTGRLRSSITAAYQGLTGEVSTNVKYAGAMEFGTGGSVDVKPGWEEVAEQYRGKGIRSVNIAPRPYMRPALEQNAPLIVGRINDRIKRELD